MLGIAHLTLAAKTGTKVMLCRHASGTACVVKAFARRTANPVSIRRERDALHKLAHPLIVALLETTKDDSHVYIVMEAALCGPLHRHIRKGLSVATAQIYAAQTAHAVEYMHGQGVIHRDLKASNVVLDDAGRIKIVDFGAAALVARTGICHTICGTAHCMAPEMIRRTGHGYAVDLWALGVLFLEMLTRQPPFWHHDEAELQSQILAGIEARKKLDASIPHDTRDAIRTLLSSRPEKRRDALQLASGFGLAGADDWARVVDRPPPDYRRDLGYVDWADDDTRDIDQSLFTDF